SCVAICIYDEEKKIAGMAHVMLPKNNTGKSTKHTKQEGKFADDAIDIILEKLTKQSSDLKLQAKIAGGAKIFAHESESGTLNIGNKNIIGIRLILQEKKIPLVSQSVGAKSGRWVTFHCGSQRVIVKEKEGEKII
ncbi:chemotaxis protein CheD, partial [bacterium]|nr:chemotaxis protein CheD [bacterium]